MGFFSKLKALFSRKKKEQKEDQAPKPETPKPLQQAQKTDVTSKEEEFVKEKKCPNCSAPNSESAPICWLCKKQM